MTSLYIRVQGQALIEIPLTSDPVRAREVVTVVSRHFINYCEKEMPEWAEIYLE